MKKVALANVINAILLITTVLAAITACRTAFADQNEYYIICNPDSYVHVRKTPKKGGEETGQLYCGDRVVTDGKRKNGYLHCIDLSTEYGEGWVHLGYIVSDQPKIIEGYGIITSNGRVATRRWINGKRSSWIRDGTRVRILAISEEWTLTVRGFIKSEYLEVEQ